MSDLKPVGTNIKHAGLVQDQRDGKWIEYSLVDESHNQYARPVLDLVRAALARDRGALTDRQRLREIKRLPKADLHSQPGATTRAPRRGAR
jgi:DNA-binding transcriptional ArsR family regulator